MLFFYIWQNVDIFSSKNKNNNNVFIESYIDIGVNSPYFGHLWIKTHITMTVTTVNINWLSLKHVISFGQSKYV